MQSENQEIYVLLMNFGYEGYRFIGLFSSIDEMKKYIQDSSNIQEEYEYVISKPNKQIDYDEIVYHKLRF